MMNICGDCRYWHAGPIDPANLTAPRVGECRGAPPQILTAQSNRGLQIVGSAYPPVQANVPACRVYLPLVELALR